VELPDWVRNDHKGAAEQSVVYFSCLRGMFDRTIDDRAPMLLHFIGIKRDSRLTGSHLA
jgi:hypothetical protein